MHQQIKNRSEILFIGVFFLEAQHPAFSYVYLHKFTVVHKFHVTMEHIEHYFLWMI